jgi:NAD(P)-dependent dehydrogenase (short-subunit alcohol dehydrogenase family)
MANPSHLSGQVALVTGGSKGIGAAIAEALAAAGVSVASTSRSGGGPTASNLIQLKADVRKPDDAARAVRETVKAFGGLDILVNNAGVGAFVNVADMTIEQWQQVIDTNLSGVFYYCHAAIPELRKRGGGWIINISSLAGKNAFPQGAAYCASKAGLNHFSESLMQEVRYDGIRVSYIMPIRVPAERRDDLRAHLAAHDIGNTVHYPSLAEQPAFSCCQGEVPVTAREARRVISLPMHEAVTMSEVDRICDAIRSFFR